MAKNTLNIDIVPLLPTSALDDVKKRIASILGKDTNVEIEIEVDDKEVKDTFKNLPKDADKYGDDAGKKFGSSFTSGAKKLLAGAAIFSVLAVGVSAVKDATGEFRDFNAQLQNVESLGVKNVDALGKKLNELSKTTVESTSGLTAALYDTVSAGITGTQDQLVGFVEQASKVAVAGNATTADAVKGLTGVLNSYGQGVENAGKVSDIFFGTVKNGVVTFPELNASLSAVLPAAAAAGIKFEELAGNISQMTAKNVPAAQATTQLRAAIIELQKPGKDLQEAMSGVTVTLDGVSQSLTENNIGAVLEKQGLTATLQQIEQSASATGKSMTQVFSSSEAASAALLLTGKNAESANQQLQNIKDGIAEGVSTAAFESNVASLDNQLAIAGNKVQSGFNDIFAQMLPFLNNVLASLTPLIESTFNNLIPIFTSVFEILKPVISNLILIIGPVVNTALALIGGLVTGFEFLFQGIQIGLPVIIAFGAAMAIGNASLIKSTALSKAKLFWDKAVTTATLVWTTVQKGLNLALVNNPIGLIITAIGLLVAGVIYAYNNFDGFKNVVDKVWEAIKKFAGVIFDAIEAVGKFLGLIDEKKPEAPFKDVNDSAKETTKSIEGMNDTLAEKTPEINLDKTNDKLKVTGKTAKENTKLVVDYFNAFKDGQDELIRMAKLEDEITRIREERSKSTKDEIAEQSREIDALLDYRTKLAKSLADGFVINDAGKKIKITADEKVDLTETLANLDTDLKFASKNLEKLTITAEIDEAKLKRETAATIAELQRERLEIEVDMGIKPKTDLLDAYKQDLIALDVAIAGAETIEQEKLQNDRLKKLKQINTIEKELNQNAADKAAEAYKRSFQFAVDTFEEALNGAFQSIEPNTARNDAIDDEIKKLDEKKAKTLKDYKEGIISAQQYNSTILEIEAERVDKVKELNNIQFNSFKILTDGLSKAFTTVSDKYQEMANANLKTIKELSKKEQEYQELQSQGVAIPAELQLAHEQYGQAASDAIAQMAVSTGSAFASMLLEGKNVAKSLALLALDTLDSVIPVLVAQIFGQALAQLGPIGGAVAAATGIGLLKGLVAIAKSSLGGAETGVYNLSNANKGKPGATDSIPMMLAPGESVASAVATVRNPVIAAIVRDGMTEEEYYNKVYLPRTLAKFKINMPAIGMSVMPAELNDKSFKQLQDSAKWVQLLDERYKIIDKQRLSIAVKRDAEATEYKQQTRILSAMAIQSKEDSKLLREEIKQLKVDIKRNTKLQLDLVANVTGEDIKLALKAKDRRSVH